MYRTRIHIAGMLVIGGLMAGTQGSAAGSDKTPALVEDRVVAGSPKDFMEVRHIVLKGSNEAIGRTLAAIGQERFGLKPRTSSNPLRNRAERHYLQKNYPILFERMRGVAAFHGKDVEDDGLVFSDLAYLSLNASCSVVYFPPDVTANGKGIVSRDYDFSTGTVRGTRPPAGQLPWTARPYVVEMHPDRGYASIAICAYDMLNGVLDGINSEGLTVAILADDELVAKFGMEPANEGAVGLGIFHILRFLLDTCANVEEAKETLLTTKQYYELLPCHYLVADRHGHAFVWEYSQAHNREYIMENPGKPLVTTNFSLHRYGTGATPPSAEKVASVCPRYCRLSRKINEHTAKVTPEFVKEVHRQVDATQAGYFGRPPARTLWHALYSPEEGKMQVSFYLGDEKGPAAPRKTQIRRTEYIDFKLRTGQ